MSCIMITYSDFPKKKITLESGRNYGVNTNAGVIIPFDSYFRRSACTALYIASGTDTGNIPSGPQNIIGMQIQLKVMREVVVQPVHRAGCSNETTKKFI